MSNDNPYQPQNVPLFESIYGKHLISLGGEPAIDNMFSDLNIIGLTALDVGFGLGGVAFYLAERYQMNVKGVEIHPWMIQYAQEHAPKHLQHQLQFDTYTKDGQLPYPPSTFDLAYSKGVLNHVADKHGLLQNIHTALKPNGLLVIADWIFPHATTHPSLPLVCETHESYEHALLDSGFEFIAFRDDSSFFLTYAHALLNNLEKNAQFIKQHYDEKVFSTIWQEHEELITKINRYEKYAVRIIATRP